jgi:phosphoglycolate phosphatase
MKLVVFDCDGTIVDSQHIIVTAMTRAFEAEGKPVPGRDKILSIVGLSLPSAVERLLKLCDADAIARIAENYKAAFHDLRQHPEHHEPLFPGARETIEALARRGDVVLGVATGKSRRGVDVLFEREGLGRYFPVIQTSDHHPSKPHPAMLHAAMDEAGIGPSRTVMIGDTSFDVEMALAAGTGAMGVGWGYHPPQTLERCGAHTLIEAYDELVPALDKLFSEREVLA